MKFIRSAAILITLFCLTICVIYTCNNPLISEEDTLSPLVAPSETDISESLTIYHSPSETDAVVSPTSCHYPSGAAETHSGITIQGTVIVKKAAVYSSAGNLSSTISYLKKGDVINIGGAHEIDNTIWYYFNLNGETAWVNGKYISSKLVKDTGTRTVRIAAMTAAAPVYSGAGSGYTQVASLNKGDTFDITGSKSVDGTTWYCFVMNGSTVWVNGQSVKINMKVESAPTAVPGANHEDVKNPNYNSRYYIIVYTKNNTVRVLEKDISGKYSIDAKLFLCSTAKSGKITPAGLYSIDKRYDWRAMFGGVYAQYAVRFYGNYLFHSVPYYTESHSNLEMEEFEKLGQGASLGCVRLCARDAKWIYDNCPNGTQVRVISGKNGPSHSETEPIPELNYNSPYNGWDPTDPHKNNPYNK